MKDDPLLRAFGARLRAARKESGISAAELARRAGLSRRFLTEAEAGRANPSLLNLSRLATALELSLAELVDLGVATYPGARIALVGLRGAGKTSVGKRLARELEAPFVELDQRVEALAGLDLAALFALHGEGHFHLLEAEALEEVLREGDHLVLATGGSIVASPKTFARLLRTCRTVWLRAEPEEHLRRVEAQGDSRPMANRPRAMDELREILAGRETLYSGCEFEVETTGRAVDDVVVDILRWHTATTS